MSDVKNIQDPSLEKYCRFCNASFSVSTGHWKIVRGAYLECKAQARETRRAGRAKLMVEKYGTEKPRESKQFHMMVDEKRRQTMTERYGASSSMHVPEHKARQAETLMKNYGVAVPAKAEAIRQRAKQTNLERYGVETNLQTPETRKRAADSKREKFSILLSDGVRLRDFCDQAGVSRAWAYKVFKHSGEAVLRQYVETYKQKITSLELTLINLMKDVTNLALYNNRPAPNVPYRPDFCIELDDKTLYVNVDGLYWHCEAKQPDRRYHQQMRQSFEAAGLRLMQFRSNELIERPETVKSMILSYFGRNQKVGARNCEIVMLVAEQARAFAEANHLMGAHPASTSYGLVHDGELVAMMGVRMRHGSLYIERFCNVLGTSVTGGFSRLLSHVEQLFNPECVYSHCDLRYASGNSYRLSGFHFDKETLGFMWTDGVNVFNRLHCTANMDDRALTEQQHADEQSLFRIYDAGQAKWVKPIKQND